MLNKFIKFQNALLNQISNITYKRYFYDKYLLNNQEKLLSILGARGVGKTTALLQYLKENQLSFKEKLYISADWIDSESIFDIAEKFYNMGGKLLIIDEIHKYPNFEKELKNIYDIFDIQVIISGSSILKIDNSKADLSRRLLKRDIKGLSFREFLELKYDIKLSTFTLEEILTSHQDIYFSLQTPEIRSFSQELKEYYKVGYYPFYHQDDEAYFLKLKETINVILEIDLVAISNIKYTTIRKFKKLIEYICTSYPYKPNIQKLLTQIDMPKTYYSEFYEYLDYLHKAKVLRIIKSANKKDAILTKPEKIYLNNPNLYYVYCDNYEIGTIRETFFSCMMEDYDIYCANKGDFIIDKYTFEIGGKNKTKKQIQNINNAFIVQDDIEIGNNNTIPLWMFGFLY